MQNTMVRGGGMISWGKKIGVREKNEKGERKKEENYIKKWGKGLKNASFWGYKLKKIRYSDFLSHRELFTFTHQS